MTNRDADVIILDRYLYDDLVRVHWKYEYSEEWLPKFTALAPEPDLVFHLDVEPEIGQDRESGREKELDVYREKRNCVNTISRDALPEDKTVRIDTSEESIDEVHEAVFSEFVSERYE